MEEEHRRRGETAEEVLLEVRTQLQNKQLDVAELKRHLQNVISDLSRADREFRKLQEKSSSRGVTFSEEFRAIPSKEDVNMDRECEAEAKSIRQREAEKSTTPKSGGQPERAVDRSTPQPPAPKPNGQAHADTPKGRR